VGMPGQHQVEFAAGELLDPGRVMEHQHVFDAWHWPDCRRFVAGDGGHDMLQVGAAASVMEIGKMSDTMD
jgi:hypothetical protein